MDALSYVDPDNIGGLNLYAYCGNNPVMNIDPDGTRWWRWVAAAVGVVLVTAAVVVLTIGTAGLGTGLLASVAIGATKGTLIGAGVGAAAGAVTGGAITGWSLDGMLSGAMIGFGVGALAGAIIGGTIGTVTYSPSMNIRWTSSRLHAGERMAQRGISQNMINTVLRKGKYIPQTIDKFKVTGRITTIITTTGELITVWKNDGTMQRLMKKIRRIFGG